MDTEAAYQSTLDYLYSFVDYSLTRGFRNQPGLFDLDRMREFMAYLGDPQQAYPFLHVAGTKGKGSVCALCAGALHAADYKVGLYTSPHLQDYAERIQIDRRPITHADLLYDGQWWLHPEYRFNHAAFRPRQMTPEELTEGCWDCRRRWNTFGSIFWRMWDFKTHLSSPVRLLAYLQYNPIDSREARKKQGMLFGLRRDEPGPRLAARRPDLAAEVEVS